MSNNPSTIPQGNTAQLWTLALTISPSSVAPNTTAEQTFTVKGVKVGDYVDVVKPTLQAGLSLANVRVSAADTLAIAFGNLTAATITPTASETYTVQVARPDNFNTAGTAPFLNNCP
jgi:hypothetical protein